VRTSTTVLYRLAAHLNSGTVILTEDDFVGSGCSARFHASWRELYVSGAEKIIANINLLADAARQGRVLLISSPDAHSPDDPERDWPRTT